MFLTIWSNLLDSLIKIIEYRCHWIWLHVTKLDIFRVTALPLDTSLDILGVVIVIVIVVVIVLVIVILYIKEREQIH